MKGLAYVKSSFSLLESNISIKDALATAKSFGYDYLALVDTNNMHGALDWIFQSRGTGIKTIIGLELEVTDENYPGKILLYAHSPQGIQNLSILSTWKLAHQKPITWDLLQTKKEGLTLVLHPTQSILESLIFKDSKHDIFSLLEQLVKSFEKVYIGCSILENNVLNEKLKKVSQKSNVPIILTNTTQYLKKENYIVPELLNSIRNSKKANLDNDFYKNNYFMSPEEIKEKVDQNIIDNTNKFFETTWFYQEFPKTQIPSFPLTNNETKDQLLGRLCVEGLKSKLGENIPANYKERLQKEISVIKTLNFQDYFLIVWDFIKFAKDNNIRVGPGRGSAAGSLVSYSLDITKADPIKFDLLFERFLNIDRISMPDIDIDFEDERREEVIQYVQQKYGKEHIAHITTFQTIGAKMSIRDVGRILELPISQVDLLSKYVPNKPGITLDLALEKSLNFKKEATKNLSNQKLIKYAKLIEGIPRQLGTHAAGVVLSDRVLTEYIPMTTSKNSSLLQTQYSMHHLEEIGLLKMDFLGLRNLSTINKVIKSVKENTKEIIDIKNIPMNDSKTLELFASATTEGIFQLESFGMKDTLKKMKPQSLEELGTTIALFRPGPMSNIPDYISRKNGKQTIKYLHPDLKPILQKTQGIIVYQEQIMQIATTIAGFPYSKSDILRRAMSKKKIDLMVKLEDEFISGAKTRGYNGTIAKQIYNLIYEFANYGFNSAHSISYALIGYQLGYLKANYPKHFLAALLSNNLGNEVKLQKYLQESYKLKIKILPPSINKSNRDFLFEKEGVRFSLVPIQNIGEVAFKTIIKEREENGTFKSFIDFICRMKGKKLSQVAFESLIMSGCFDEFGDNRASLLKALPNVIRYSTLLVKDGQTLIYDEFILPPPTINKIVEDEEEKLENEFKTLKVYLTSHPLKQKKDEIMSKKGKIRDIALLEEFGSKQKISIVGKVSSLRVIKTKNNDTMAFATIADETGDVEAVIFPQAFDKVGHRVVRNKVYAFIGVVDKAKGLSFIIDDAKSISELI